MSSKRMFTDDVYLIKLSEDTRYTTKRYISDNNLKDRILLALDNYETIIDADTSIAYDLAHDLNAILTSIKVGSRYLNRRLTVFEQKLTEVGDLVLPKEDDDDIEYKLPANTPMTTMVQDSDVRIIDVDSKRSALVKMEKGKKLAAAARELIELSKSLTLSKALKYDAVRTMNQLLDLLKLDGNLALQLADDVNEAKHAFDKEDDERDGLLQVKLHIIKLMLDQCFEEVHRNQPSLEPANAWIKFI